AEKPSTCGRQFHIIAGVQYLRQRFLLRLGLGLGLGYLFFDILSWVLIFLIINVIRNSIILIEQCGDNHTVRDLAAQHLTYDIPHSMTAGFKCISSTCADRPL